MSVRKHRTLWLSAAVLLAVLVSAWFFAPRTRITQANFDRITKRMMLREVERILGKCDSRQPIHVVWLEGQEDTTRTVLREWCCWRDGPNMISVDINKDGKVVDKEIKLVGVWESLKWYLEGAQK
jgi:hypothetical protein